MIFFFVVYVFYFVCTIRKVLFYFKIPKSQHSPTVVFQLLIHRLITSDIAFYFRNPKISMRFEIVFLIFPVVSMPHFSVYENRDFLSYKYDIGFSD